MQKLLEKIYNKISDETDSYEILNSINSGMAITSYKDLRSKSSDISPYPMIIEEAVNKLFELRVTVIKDKVVACKIDSQWSSGRGKSDWREDIDNIPHSLFELPVDVKSKCIQLMEAMSIGYGAFDFIVTPKNEYYFLEVNPSGQWLWIDQKTKSTISKFIANCLSNS